MPEKYVNIANKTVALVMAGGRGSRLGLLTEKRAKPAVYFGGKFRIIDFPLSNCVNSNINKIALITQYKSHSLIRHIQMGWNFVVNSNLGHFLEILPASQMVDESTWYRGTADSIYQNLTILRSYPCEYFVILAGDHIYKMDYTKMVLWHIENGSDCTVSCIKVPKEDAKEFGVMGVDRNNKIETFVEKSSNPPTLPDAEDTCLASMGIYVFNRDFLFKVLKEDNLKEDSDHDFGKNIIPHCVEKFNTYAFPYELGCVKYDEKFVDYWKDVGTIKSYWEANIDLTLPLPPIDLYQQDWNIYTYQNQLPPAKFLYNNTEENRIGRAYDSLVSAGVIISGGLVERSVLFQNVKVNSYSSIKNSILFRGVNIDRNCTINKAIIEVGCHIPPNTVIGENDEDDRKRFYKTDDGITIVTKKHSELLK